MKRLLCPSLPTPQHPVQLPPTEADHALKVLRLRDGDEVVAMDGRGHAAQARIRVTGGGGAKLEFVAEAAGASGPGGAQQGWSAPAPVVLELSILKGDAMEWAVEKAVELGASELVPLVTAHTVVQIKQKGPEAFQSRWQKIADQALKQCGRLERLEVRLPVGLEDHLAATSADGRRKVRLWCDETERQRAPELVNWLKSAPTELSELRLLIGPEGGWSAGERDLLAREPGMVRVGLGPWVLRAETAALFTLSLACAHFRGLARP